MAAINTPKITSQGKLPHYAEVSIYDKTDTIYDITPLYGPSCFPAGTLISMADGTQKPIESVQIGDEVLAFAEGECNTPLVPRKVVRLFDNITQDFIRLSSPSLKNDIVVTPGHHFYRPDGTFLETR
jgi:ABC-type molybdate transport system ATPase subunit